MKSFKMKILEHEIDVQFESPDIWAENGMGRCSFKKGALGVDHNMPHDVQCSIFMHELVHLIGEINSIELTEQTIDGVAIGLLSFIKNNPEFIIDNLMHSDEIIYRDSKKGLQTRKKEGTYE